MNKIFKVIWNHSAQRFDVCSELTHAHGKSASSTDERSSVVKTIAISALAAGAVLGSADVMAANVVISGTEGDVISSASAVAHGTDSVVIGNDAQSKLDGGVALGYGVVVEGLNGFAAGRDSLAGNGSTAIGYRAQAIGNNTIAIGEGAKVEYHARGNSYAIGSRSYVQGENAIAFGTSANATANRAIAIGFNSNVTSTTGIALGYFAVSSGRYSIAQGSQSESSGDRSIAIGNRSFASGTNSLSIGTEANVTAENNVVLGSFATENSATNSVGGQGKAVDDATVNGITYSGFAGDDKLVGVVSVGNGEQTRQIINVAPGEISENSTDAINGSQLYLAMKNFSETIPEMPEIPAVETTTLSEEKVGDDPTGKIATPEEGDKLVNATTVANAINAAGWKTNSTSASVNEDGKDTLINAGDQVNFEKGVNLELTKQVTTVDGKDTVTYTYSTVMSPVFDNVTTGGDVSYEDAQGNPLTKKADGTYTNAAGDVVNPSDVVVKADNPIVMGKDADGDNAITGLDSHLPAAVDEEGNPLTVKYEKDPNDPNKLVPVYYNADGTKYTGTATPTDVTKAPSLAKPDYSNSELTEAATLNDVLNAGWNLGSSNGSAAVEALDFVTPYNTVNFKQGKGITITTDSDGDTSNIEIKVDDGKTAVDPTTGKAVPASYTTTVTEKDEQGNDVTKEVPVTLSYDAAGNPVYTDENGNTVDAADVAPADNANKVATVSDVVNTINSVGWWTNSTSTEGNTEGEAANTLVNPGDQVNFEAGKNMLVEQNVETVDGKDTITYTYKTQDDVEFNTVTLKEPTETTYETKEGGKPVTKEGNKYYTINEITGEKEEVPADEVTEVKPDPVPAVVMKTEKATPSNISDIKGDEEQPRSALTLGDENGEPVQLKGIASSLNTAPVTSSVTGANATVPDLLDLSEGNYDPTAAVTAADLANYGWVVSVEDNEYADAVKNANEVKFIGGEGITVEGKTNENVREITISVDTQNLTPEQDPTTATPTGKIEVPTADNGGNNFVTANTVANAINAAGWLTNSTSASVNEDDTDTLINAGDQVNFEKGANLELTKQVTTENGKDTVTYTYSTVMNPVFENVTTGGDVTYETKDGKPLTKEVTKNDAGEDVVVYKDADGKTVNLSDVVAKVANPIFMGKDDAGNNVVSGLDSHLPKGGVDKDGKPVTDVKNVANPYSADNPAPVTEAATLGDVLNAGWNLQITKGEGGVEEKVDFVTPYNTVNFIADGGIEISQTSDGDLSNITIRLSDAGVLKLEEMKNNPAGDSTTPPSGKVEVGANPGGFVSAQNVANMINGVGWKTNSTTAVETTGENAVTGEKAENTNLVNAGDQVNFEAGKNMEITKEVAKGDNDEDVITYTYRTAEEVDFNKVTLSTDENPTDEAGNPLVKVGDQYYAAGDLDENGQPKEDAAPYDGKVLQPTTVNLVSEQGTPVNNAGTGQEDTQTPPALNITGTDADGNPSPTQLTGVASVLNTKPTDTAPAGSTDGKPTAKSPLLDLGNVDENGNSDLPQSVLNSAVTVGDLVNMGWVVSASDNNYTDVVKNANEVKFNGENGISVTGETTADGIRNINISLATGDVVTTNSEKPQGVDENNNPIDLVKVGDQYFAAGDVVNGVPNENAAPYTGPVTQATTNGKGFVTGNQVADAIQESGWTVAINNDAAGETVRTPDQVEKVNPNDNVRFADGSNTQVRMITKEVIEPNGVNSTTTTVRIDAVVPTVYTDKNGNKVAQAADGNWYTLDENGLPNTAATPVKAGDIIASMVNPTNAVDNPTAGNPTTLSNLASTLPGAEGVAAGDVGVEDGDISPAATKRAAPTLTAAQKSNAATVDDVLNAGWNLQENGNAKDFVKSYDTVNFVNGTGTEVNITTTPDGLASNVTVNVKTENSDTITLGVNPATGNIQANAITAPLAMEGTTDANGNPVTDDAGNPVTTGRVVVPTNPNALVSAAQVANAINNSGFDLDVGKVADSSGEVTANDATAARVNPGNKVTVNAGNNIQISRSGSNINIATVDNPVFQNITVGGSSISSTANGDVKIAKANGAPARITNVAAGVDPMDAVNVQQFKDGLRAVDKRARRGIATAAAMGHLPQPHLDGHSMFSVGTVSYRGEQGVAVGYSRISDNGKHIIKLSGATNTSGHKDVMVGASYGYEW